VPESGPPTGRETARPGGAGGAPPDTSKGGTGDFLKSKMLGLPTWAWLALAAAGGIVALVWMQNRKGAAPAVDNTRVPDDQAMVSTEQYESLLALLRDQQGVPSTATPAPAPALPVGAGWDFVRPGDSLAKIAARWPGDTVAILKSFNSPGELNRLTVGEPIRVRGKAGARPANRPGGGRA
jgi:hypothetical protein